MTIENELDYNKGLDINRINQEPILLNEQEIIDENTDLAISKKLVDEDGDTILLIEAGRDWIDRAELNRYVFGCFIRRFEYIKEFLDCPFFGLLNEFIQKFENRVEVMPIPDEQSGLSARYHYLWAKRPENRHCLIASLLKLPPLPKNGDYIIYKKNLNYR